jgi:hypothetical protein
LIFTKEEKRTTSIAVIGGAAVLLVYYVFLPRWNEWTRLGAVLDSKVRYLEKLHERAAAQNALLARRDELAKKFGAVEGSAGQPGGGAFPPSMSLPPPQPPPGPAPKPGAKPGTISPKVASAPSTPATATAPPAAPGKAPAKAVAAQPAPQPAAPPIVTVAAYVERQANAAGIRLNSMTPVTPASCYKAGKSFTPVGLQVSMETATPSLIRLLHALEKGNRLIRVEQMDLRHDIKKGPMVAATLYIVGYESSAR